VSQSITYLCGPSDHENNNCLELPASPHAPQLRLQAWQSTKLREESHQKK
jgi:hypothetical protein